MTPAYVVQITTPKKYILNGLWFGPKKAKTVMVLVHGLAGSMFSETEKKLAKAFSGPGVAVLLFNNRGHDIVSKLYGEAPRTKKGYKRILAGAAHEVFADCVDDLEGVVTFAENAGAKRIVLVGHSTGCQKSIYWASRKEKSHAAMKAIVLLAPVSDRAAFSNELGARTIAKAEGVARAMIRSGKPHGLMPSKVWPDLSDAQRALSLIAKDSKEEIFLYALPNRKPTTLQKVRTPILACWAQYDEFSSHPAREVAAWLRSNLKSTDRVIVVPRVAHSFKGSERQVAKEVAKFMKER